MKKIVLITLGLIISGFAFADNFTDSIESESSGADKSFAGTCYADFGCSSVIVRDVSADRCSRYGGHSWSSNMGGRCERL